MTIQNSMALLGLVIVIALAGVSYNLARIATVLEWLRRKEGE